MALKLVKLVTTGEGIVEHLTAEWDALVKTNPHSTFFQLSSWYRTWIKSAAKAEKVEPILIKILSGKGNLRAALALQIKNVNHVPTICPLTSPWADYHEIIAKPNDTDAIKALDEALSEFILENRLPVFCDDIVTGGILETVLSRLPTVKSPSTLVGAIDLTDANHVNQILRKKEHVLKWRRLQKLGKVSCCHHTQYDVLSRRLPVFIEMHRRQWSDRSNVVAPFNEGTVDKTFEAMVQNLSPKKLIILTELLLDHQPIAMYFGFLYRGDYGGYRTTFDQSYYRLSPGHLMLHRMIIDFISYNIRKIDLMRGAYSYKLKYTNKNSNNQLFVIPNPNNII